MMLTLSVFSVEPDTTTVQIGNQRWMKKNLNVGTMRVDKDCYNNLESNCSVYGGLYGWSQLGIVNEGDQGICPTGFHIPTKSECRELDVFLGGIIMADGQTSLGTTSAKKLKEVGFNHWMKDMIGAGTDQYDFAALGTGYKYGTYYAGLQSNGYFWTSTSMSDGKGAWMRSLGFFRTNLGEYGAWKEDQPNGYKASKLPVRCIKNQ